jgi:hypothetical protein
MPQISKGDTFADTQQLTAARLNQLVDSATLAVGAISEQTAITANTVEATDSTIINDGGVLKKATVGDLLGSGINVTTKSVTSTANNDVTVTPYDGVIVTGSTYVSTDGLTVTVTTTAAHNLVVNNVVLISAAGTGYNGTFRVSAVTTNTFQYVMFTAATAMTTPTACNYVRKATVIDNGNSVVSENSFVNNTVRSPNVQTDTLTAKTTNVTSAIQYSGVPVMGLASTIEVTIPFAQCNGTTASGLASTCSQWVPVLTISSLTKTNKELWTVEADFTAQYFSFYGARFRIIQVSTGNVLCMEQHFLQGFNNFHLLQVKMRAVIPDATVFTSDSIRVEMWYSATAVGASNVLNVGYGGALTDPTITRLARITKFNKP